MHVELDAKYSIGNDYIDGQHALLVRLVDMVSLALITGKSKEQFVRLLHEVKKYAEYHFVSEENYMAEIAYPDRIEHARIHSEMLAELSLRIARTNVSRRNGREVSDFLHAWLSDHIVNEDGRLAAYARRGKRFAA